MFNQMVGDEEDKFYLADRDEDTNLDVAEYAAFLHPQNYDYMHDHEIDNSLVDYDKNKDGFVSFAEYLGEGKCCVCHVLDHDVNFLLID